MPSPSLPPPLPAAAGWTRNHDKAFENAIAACGAPDWEAIAAAVPGKTADEVRRHYGILVEDLDAIEAGRVPIPQYAPAGGWGSGAGVGPPEPERGLSRSERERRKGTPWSEDEHRDFLIGLKIYGKGDWRSISRHHVISRTPTQVASHAQKYFIRQSSITKKDRRRTSIHDITSVKQPPSSTS